MNRKKILGLAVALALCALAASASQVQVAAEWVRYAEPQLDVSFEYPGNWHLEPREDSEGFIGGVIALSERDASSDEEAHAPRPVRIEIGLHAHEIEPGTPIADWSRRLEAGDPFQDAWLSRAEGQVLRAQALGSVFEETAKRGAYRGSGRSRLTDYTYLNIPRGRAVWFVWMNSVRQEDLRVFDRLVRSLRFEPGAPETLKAAYGASFEPSPLPAAQADWSPEGIRQIAGAACSACSGTCTCTGSGCSGTCKTCDCNTADSGTNASGYRSPLLGNKTISCGNLNAEICCGTHKGQDKNAVDLSVATQTNVYNPIASTFSQGGYSPTGYGVWVKYTESTRTSLYAHLYSYVDNTNKGVRPKCEVIAKSGSSGGVSPHLHFALRAGTSPIRLTNATGINLGANFPNCQKTKCCDGGFSCDCGTWNGGSTCS